MSRGNRKGKRDENEAEIVEALRMIPGCMVVLIDEKDIPDLDVGFQGVNYKLEVKTKSGKLTKGQRDFFDAWPGQCAIVRTVEDALKVIGVSS